jgi:hypothetical protein
MEDLSTSKLKEEKEPLGSSSKEKGVRFQVDDDEPEERQPEKEKSKLATLGRFFPFFFIALSKEY